MTTAERNGFLHYFSVGVDLMPGYPLTRREFLVDSGLAVGFTALSNPFTMWDKPLAVDEVVEAGKPLYHLTSNGASLFFYFINLRVKGGQLIPHNRSEPSYLVVQIPPQSLHEEFYEKKLDSSKPTERRRATLAGPSFLSFLLWPIKGTKRRRMSFDVETLLSWDNRELFALQTALDHGDRWKALGSPSAAIDVTVTRDAIEGKSYDLDYYRTIAGKILKSNDGPPLTVFELPAGLLMAPLDSQREDGSSTEVVWQAIQNTPEAYPKRRTIYKREYEFTTASGKNRRTIQERWDTEIRVLRTNASGGVSHGPPALRAVGIVDRIANHLQAGQSFYLPTFEDEKDIAYLTQLAGQFTKPKFDIGINGPFRFTQLGASTQFAYKNHDINGLDTDLVEYEHHFHEGRDTYIKIARIGVEFPSGLRAIHVQLARRVIVAGTSFLEYEEYTEPVEKVKVFSGFPGEMEFGGKKYQPFVAPGAEGVLGYTFGLNQSFSRIEAAFSRTPPITPVTRTTFSQTDRKALNPLAFWSYRLMRQEEQFAPSFENLLKVPHRFYDRNGALIGTLDIPILFLRRKFFEDPGLRNQWLQGNKEVQSLKMWDDERLRIPISGSVAAMTRDVVTPSSSAAPNKVNQVATEWIEQYFDIAPLGTTINVFDVAEYPIYPQVRRAKIFLDHVQQYGGKKLPSVVSYAEAYLRHEFNPARDKNAAQVFLQRTEEYRTCRLTNLSGKLLQADPALGETLLDPDLFNGDNKIQDVFKGAGEQLGGLANPDPSLHWVSLSESALSLPRKGDIHTMVGLNQLDPRALFGGRAAAEIFAGISLADILQTLGLEDAPAFLLQKIPNDLRDPTAALRAIGENPVVKNALAIAGNIEEAIAKAEAFVAAVKAEVKEAENKVARFTKALRDLVPDQDKVLETARLQFEAARLDIIDPGSLKEAAKQVIVLEFMRALRETGITSVSTGLTQFVHNQIKEATEQAIATIKEQAPPGKLPPAVVELTDELAVLISELPALGKRVDAIRQGLAKAHTTDARELLALIDVAAGPRNANRLVNTAFKTYSLYKDKISETDRRIWDTTLLELDMVRRLGTAYVLERRQRLDLDVADMLRTVPQGIFDAIQAMPMIQTQARRARDQALAYWKANNIHDAVEEIANFQNLNKYYIEAADQLWESLNIYANGAHALRNEMERQRAHVEQLVRDKLRQAERELVDTIRNSAQGYLERLSEAFEQELRQVTDSAAVREATAAYERLSKVLNALKRQELACNWSTSRFKPADLGVVQFLPQPNATKLDMMIKGVIELDPFKMPPVVKRTEIKSETSVVNFKIMFLNVIEIDFERVRFVAGTGSATDIKVDIRGVQFAGSLSFIQALQELISGLVDGMRVEIGPKYVAVGYQSPTFSFGAPGFTFSNLSIGVLLTIAFDRRPMALRFNLAYPESKATIAAGIYGGCFFCALTVDTKRGIIATEMALEMGAYQGISFGPFKGYVKFMIGLHYRKDDEGVLLEGYFIAEGSLSVWIFVISARLYMGIRSQNSYAEGFCIASASFKVGLIKKKFEHGYKKRLAGAKQNSSDSNKSRTSVLDRTGEQEFVDWESQLEAVFSDPVARIVYRAQPVQAGESARDVQLNEFFVDEFQHLTNSEFIEFQRKFFSSTR